MTNNVAIFAAKKIITMNQAKPYATHMAVREGRVLAVGDLDEVKRWGGIVDNSLADKVLMPGFVEGHCHAFEGALWSCPYVGFHDRHDPEGRLWWGLTSIDAVVERLREEDSRLGDDPRPIFAWGFDPMHFGDRRADRADFDRVSKTRPIAILHASIHLLNVNSALMEQAGITRALNIHGIAKGPDGEPTGELREMAAMYLAYKMLGNHSPRLDATSTPEPVWRFAKSAQLKGVTTVTDLLNELGPATVDNYRVLTARDDFPVRVVPALNPTSRSTNDGIKLLKELVPLGNEKLHFGLVKIITDGSMQGFTARIKWPHYYENGSNGLWNVGPQDLRRLAEAYHRAGFQLHIHVNGDEASEVAIEVMEDVLGVAWRPDHRHTLQHCQMIDTAQIRRMKALELCANLFANHIYYYGDHHYNRLLGPDRANRVDPVGTVARHGVPFAIHSDAPVTPLGPLFTASCAVNRRTTSGRVLGEEERISVHEALRAITLGAAYTLKLDHLVGSLEVGKFADVAILDRDPYDVPPEDLGAMTVWGTLLGGKLFRSNQPAARDAELTA
jgi:predicted amidohydrolase YtcJ